MKRYSEARFTDSMLRTRLILLLLLAALSTTVEAQERILWANEVISFSSQYESKNYSADQVMGPPNALGSLNKNEMAWVPKKETSATGEHIEVAFAQAIRVKQVAIGESNAPGAIERIYLIDTKGIKHQVFYNKTPKNILQPFRLFRHTFPKTNYLVKGLRLELKTKSVAGSNQIDAIAISESSVPIKAQINQVKYEKEISLPIPLGPGINSQYPERLPIISPDGNTLFFARKYHPQNMGDENYDDIWVAQKNRSGKWSYATNVGSPLNNKDHNFSVAFNPTGDMLYLANDYRSSKKDGLSFSRKKGRVWSNPVTMNIKDLYNDSDFVSYYVSQDGAYLLMAIERKEGFGDRDIYVSFRENEKSWGAPINLGNVINTVGMESGAFLAADGKTLYFSSNGHAGFGGLDMFVSRRLDNTWKNWSTPMNIGKGINTANNEYNYTIPAKGDFAYFASDNASGQSDIFKVELPKEMRPDPVVLYSGKIIDSKTNAPINNAKLEIKSLSTSKTKSSLVALGNYQIAMPFGEDLEVYANISGYYTVSQRLNLSGEELEKLDYDDTSVANNAIGDQELEALKNKINKINKEIDRLESERGSFVNDKYKSRTQFSGDSELDALKRKYQNSQGEPKVVSNTPTSSNSNDKELNSLRDKLNSYNNSSPDPNADLPDLDRTASDKSLDDMKKKYQQYFEEESTTDVEQKPKAQTSKKKAETENFDFVKEKIREEQRAELLPKVIDELEETIKPQAIAKVKATLSPEEKKIADDPQLLILLNDRLRANPLIRDYSKPTKTNFSSLDVKLEKEIRSQIKSSTEESLFEEFAPLMSKHIEQEFAYIVKKEAESYWQLQLLVELEKKESQPLKPKALGAKDLFKPIPEKYKEEKVDLIAIPLEAGQTIPLNNIFFEANKSEIQDISSTELERVLTFLSNYSEMVVEIGGHTNGWCSHQYANNLSTQRAEEVAQFFVDKGIPSNRIKSRGYGKTKPIADNDTLVGRKKNQRVELKILSM